MAVYRKTLRLMIGMAWIFILSGFMAVTAMAEEIPSPKDILGFEIGDRPVRYDEAVRYLQVLAEKSPRIRLYEQGVTHEGRKTWYAVISSADNMARLEDIRDGMSRLFDPRKTSGDTKPDEIIQNYPAVVWLMYSIHGDELSGTDASLKVAYELLAGEDAETLQLLDRLIIGIDPMQNPDGRERYLAQMQQWNGAVPISDAQSIQHRGQYPGGRTNHYLFDLNRDWFIQSQPETRARVQTLQRWYPQVVVDAHEMGSYDTYLFNPPREPINPYIVKTIRTWWDVFAADQAKAFDQYGWSYYTRSWYENWYPGYSNWASFLGAIDILYEQASTDGTLIKRPDGTYLSFREAVEHQFVSSMANIQTAADNRRALLEDFYRMRSESLKEAPGKEKTYYIDPAQNPHRVRCLIGHLMDQGIEVHVAAKAFSLSGARDYFSRESQSVQLPAGTFIIPTEQPQQPLLRAILEFDTRLRTDFLKSERESLEKGKGTRMYEVSAWSMPQAYGLNTFVSNQNINVSHRLLDKLPEPKGELQNPDVGYGFLIPYQDDAAPAVLIELLNSGYNVRAAEKPFRIENRAYDRGTLLIRRHENPALEAEQLREIAQRQAAFIIGVNTALCSEGPDLGGNEYELLRAPKTALLTGNGISTGSFGSIWHLLDYEYHLPLSVLDVSGFGRVDLRKYNVLIIPSGWGGSEGFSRIFGKNEIGKIKTWVMNGGTLIAVGGAGAFLADSSSGISKVALRRQALKNLADYEADWQAAQDLKRITIDSLGIWENKPSSSSGPETKGASSVSLSDQRKLDQKQQLFMPRGAILRVNLDEEFWLNYGMGNRIPAILYSSYAFMAKRPVKIAGRFASAADLRISGLLWPEARQRWEKTAYLTREGMGNGQIILFADEPVFRSYFYGTARLLMNAILLGPGLGARQPVEF